MTQIKERPDDRRRMAANLETAMLALPSLPLPQTIYLAGVAVAFGLFIVTLFVVSLTSKTKN